MKTAAVAAAITAHLVYREHAAGAAAARAGCDLAAIRADRYFFRAWWLDVIDVCVAASPAITDHPGAVLDRLATRHGLHLSDAYLPRCSRCRIPLRWRDVAGPRPTGRCRLCDRPPAHHPAGTSARAPRALDDRFELLDPTDLSEVA